MKTWDLSKRVTVGFVFAQFYTVQIRGYIGTSSTQILVVWLNPENNKQL